MPAPLRFWHLLSFDAPTVAAVWACLLAHAAGVRPSLYAIMVLTLGAWLLYVADRLLDARRNANPVLLRERHSFAARYRRRFIAAGLLVGAVLAWLVAMRMTSEARLEDAVIFCAAMLYFAAVHLATRNKWLPKELAVAILFAAATAVPAWSQLSFAASPASAHPLQLAFASLIFAALCWLNCMAIEHWEADEPASNLPGISGPGTRWPGKQFSGITAGIAGFALAVTILFLIPTFLIFVRLQPLAPVLLCAVASALLLFVLENHRHQLSRMQLRIAADLALLTPLLLLPQILPPMMKWQLP